MSSSAASDGPVGAAQEGTGPVLSGGWLLPGAYACFVLLGWYFTLLPSLIRSVEHDFHQSDAAFGVLYLVRSILFAVGALGGGLLTERAGRRVVLSASVLLCGSGLALCALTASWPVFVLGAALASWGSGGVDAGTNGLVLDLVRDARGAALNLLHLFFGLGALVGPFLVGFLISVGTGWRVLLVSTAALFVVLAVPFAGQAMPSGRHVRVKREPSGGGMARPEVSLVPFVWLALSMGCYIGAEVGVSSWLVRLLAAQPLVAATSVLTVFWAGLAAGRLMGNWVAERLDYYRFTIGATLAASLFLLLAVLLPWPLLIPCYGLSGLFFGPVYPMIMVLGGTIYPRRLATLSGSLTTASAVGSIVYPPLMGLMAASVGLRGGMLGAALLGLPGALAIVAARRAASAGASGSRASSSPG